MPFNKVTWASSFIRRLIKYCTCTLFMSNLWVIYFAAVDNLNDLYIWINRQKDQWLILKRNYYLLPINSIWSEICSDNVFYLEYELVAENKTCTGQYGNAGIFHKVSNCADACREMTKSMFAFGRRGSSRCSTENGCKCWCQKDSLDGVCTGSQIYSSGYDLYRIKQEGKSSFFSSKFLFFTVLNSLSDLQLVRFTLIS